jgi:hypothetical protein
MPKSAKEDIMKLISIALIASLTVAGYAHAQASAQAPSQAPAAQAAPKSKACKKEVKDLCGRRPKGEEASCIKDGLDLNKFSDSCKGELTAAPKPNS